MLWLLLFPCTVVCGAYSMQTYQMCPGTPFYVPRPPEYNSNTSYLHFARKGTSSPEIVLRGTTPTDNHYSFKDETLFISELRERDAGVFSWSDDQNVHKTIKLEIKDCAVPQAVMYGQPLELRIPPEAFRLKFQPNQRSTKTLWIKEGMAGKSGRGVQKGSKWIARQITFDDQGSYIFQKQSGTEISKIQVKVTAHVEYFNMDENDENGYNWNMYVPTNRFKMFFRSDIDPSIEMYAVERGLLTKDGENRFKHRIELNEDEEDPGVNIVLTDLKRSDAGIYEVSDSDHRIIALRFLHASLSPDYSMFLYALIPVGLFILLCVCLCKCCRSIRKSKTPSDPQDATPAQPYTAIGMNDMEPTSSTEPYCASNMGPGDSVPSTHQAMSPPAPSAQDPAPQFQLRGFGDDSSDIPSTFPLTMDTTTST